METQSPSHIQNTKDTPTITDPRGSSEYVKDRCEELERSANARRLSAIDRFYVSVLVYCRDRFTLGNKKPLR